MKIQRNAADFIRNKVNAGKPGEADNKEKEAVIKDKVDVGGPAENRGVDPSAARKVFGTVGTAAGVIAGRALILPGAGAAFTSAMVGTAIGGPLGTVIGAAAGLAVGAVTEYKTKIGRWIGGLVGGAVGSVLGTVASAAGYRPSPKMAEETRGFSFKSLFKKLLNPSYTSHKKISAEKARDVIKNLKPGDLIITNNDEDYRFELAQKLMGKSGNWTHIGIVDENKKVLEVLISTDGPTESDPEKLFTENHHVVILRPDYKNLDSVKKTLAEARKYFGKSKYDFDFRLSTEDKLYCQEYVYKAMQRGAPEIKIKPSRFMGIDFISADDFIESPDVKQTWTTGSNFWMNLLSKFD